MEAVAVTRGIRVEVQPHFSPEHSDRSQGHWFFLYQVRITNESDGVAQLMSRHWIITDAYGQVEEVRGPGVVGERPRLQPGQAFEYTSGCPLGTPFGSMEGSYQMIDGEGTTFEVQIPPFSLREPNSMH